MDREMVDLYLQAMMHGDHVSKNRPTATTSPKDKFDLAAEKYIKEYIDSLNLEIEYAQNAFVTPAMKKAEVRAAFLEKLKATEEDIFLLEAFNFIKLNESQYFDDESHKEILEEFKKLEELIEKMNPTDHFPEEIHSFFNFDVNIGDKISLIAIQLFQEENYRMSVSLFILLTTFLPENYEFLFRLGIAAQKCELYDLALKAYSEALKIDEELIGAKLFLVECYLEKNLIEEAKLQLIEAKQLVLKSESEVDEMWINFIKELENITGWL